jgi:hypothetical protein
MKGITENERRLITLSLMWQQVIRLGVESSVFGLNSTQVQSVISRLISNGRDRQMLSTRDSLRLSELFLRHCTDEMVNLPF